jgi:hypothetical protein
MRAGRRETYNVWSGQKELLKKVMIERDICMARDENTVLHVFNEYVQAFQTLRAPAVTSYFHFPCMLIAPQGVAVMANATEVESLLDKMMEGLKARGYARSELTDVEAIPLSENIVLVRQARTLQNGRQPTGAVGRDLRVPQDRQRLEDCHRDGA